MFSLLATGGGQVKGARGGTPAVFLAVSSAADSVLVSVMNGTNLKTEKMAF